MRLSIYDTQTGRIVRVVTAGSFSSVLAMVGPGEDVSEDETPDGLNDLSMVVDPETGLHRAKTEQELQQDIDSRKAVRDRMWAKEMTDRQKRKQRMISRGVSAEIADAVIMGLFEERD